MYTHMQRKHGINPPVKKFNCEFCGKGFAYKLELHDHRNTHTGEKPYLCKFCGKGFASFGTHRMHEKGHLGFKRKKQTNDSIVLDYWSQYRMFIFVFYQKFYCIRSDCPFLLPNFYWPQLNWVKRLNVCRVKAYVSGILRIKKSNQSKSESRI